MKTKPVWIIENFKGDNSYDGLIDAVKEMGCDCHIVGVKDYFVHDWESKVVKPNSCVMFQGSIQLSKTLREQLPSCFPIIWNTLENYKCTKFYPKLGKHLFNDKYAMISVAELRRQKWNYYGWFGKEAIIFVRPDDGDKSFTGGLLDLQDFDRFWDNKVQSVAAQEDLVIVSTPKNIKGEWRFVVTEKKEIITYSTYRYMNVLTKVPGAPQGAIDKCKEVLEEGYFPDPVFVIDICEDSDGKFWLLELGSFSASGLYACDSKKIAKRVSEIAVEKYEERQLLKQLPL